jgi:hypothetical protein
VKTNVTVPLGTADGARCGEALIRASVSRDRANPRPRFSGNGRLLQANGPLRPGMT